MTTRVLFLAQRIDFGAVAPNGSSAHAAATLAGLESHFDVCAVGAEGSDLPHPRRRRRVRLPPLARGALQDARALVSDHRFANRALAVAQSFRPDVIYERSEYFCTAGLRVSRRLRVPLVLEVNGLLARDVRSMYRSPLEPAGAALERAKLRRADAVVTVSPGLAELLVGLGASRRRLFVIPNSIPDDRVAQPRPVADGPVTIGWVGHLMKWHFEAARLLIDAAPAVSDQVPAARFVVIGGGPGVDELRALAARSGVADRVEITGAVPYSTLPDRLAKIDIGVIPDVFEYAFPVKLVELGASGAAVIAPRSDSLDLQIEPGVEYEPIPRGDRAALVAAMVRLARDAERRARLGSALQRAVSERFTWSATGRELAGVIDRVAAGGRYPAR